MALISVQDLNDAQADLQSLEDIVNGAANRSNPGQENGTVTTRLGQIIKTLAKAIQDIIKYSGTWSALTTYSAGEIVTYNGVGYIASVGSNLNHQPDTSPTYWGVLSAKGDTGPTGPQGPQGPAGSVTAIGSDLNFAGFKGINAGTATANQDLVNLETMRAELQGVPSVSLTFQTGWASSGAGYTGSRVIANHMVAVEMTMVCSANPGGPCCLINANYRPKYAHYVVGIDLTTNTLVIFTISSTTGMIAPLSALTVGHTYYLSDVYMRT